MHQFDEFCDICPMSKAPSSELFDLIKALSKTEKRYVKQEMKRHVLHGTSQAELLFDAIAEQSTYNEAEIKTRFRTKGFAKRLPEAKRELLEVILRAMRQYHAHRNVRRRSLTAVLDADFLRLRGLYRLAEQRLLHAAEDTKLVSDDVVNVLVAASLNDTLRMQHKLPPVHSTPDEDAVVRSARNLEEATFIQALLDRMEKLIEEYGQTSTPALRALAADLVSAGEKRFPLQSDAAQSDWLTLLSKKALFIDLDPAAALRYDRSRLDLIERNEAYRQANHLQWVGLLHGVALRLLITGNIPEALPLRDRIHDYWVKRRATLSPHNRRIVGSQYLNIEIQLALQSMELERLQENIDMVDSVLDEMEEAGPTETGIACTFNIALIQFGLGRYRDVTRRIHALEDYPDSMRVELHTASRLLHILCHVDQGHESVVTSLVRSERRRAKGTAIPADQDVLLSIATKHFSLPQGSRLTAAYKKALESLEAIPKPEGELVTSLFGFKAWLQSKILRKRWRDVLASQ